MEFRKPFNQPRIGDPSPEKPKIFRGVVFEEKVRPDGNKEYVSSDPSRKLIKIFVHPNAHTPIPGRVYDVQIISDTDTRDPMRGQYTALVISVSETPPAGVPKPEKPNTEEYITEGRRGVPITLDVSKEAMAPFGFAPGDRIITPAGKRATVVGIDKGDDMLYYQKEGQLGVVSPGRSMKEKELKAEGYRLLTTEEETQIKNQIKEQSDKMFPEVSISAPITNKKEKVVIPKPIEFDYANGKVLVLETELPLYEKALAPREMPAKFRYYAQDTDTLEVIDHVATAVELREPCQLEGETSASKTSGIEFLAWVVTGEEPFKINLNGQTDTSELIGKFVPNDGQLQIAFEDAIRHPDLLAKESKEILEKANHEGRGLTILESQKIAEKENMKISDWRWQDGLDVRAKKEGRWLILDEINLAEPQILERLNSQLDKNPSLTLSESGGMSIRPLDEAEMKEWQEGKLSNTYPLNKNFRIFSTRNPAEYSGRAPQSPAFTDRWTSRKVVKNPTKESYVAMMELMAYGEQPEVMIRGQKYKADDVEPLFKTLETIPNFRGFLEKLAKFQITLEGMARRREIGKDKKEKYIFTRRGLMEFMSYLEDKTLIDRKTGERLSITDMPEIFITRAIQYYFLNKITDADDLKRVKDQLDAIGISEDHWTHKFIGSVSPRGGKSTGAPEKVSREVFEDLMGNMVQKAELASKDGFSVGDKLIMLPEGINLPREISDSASHILVGFTGEGNYLVQLDNKRVAILVSDRVRKYFKKETAPVASGKVRPMSFTDAFAGVSITRTEVASEGGFTVGDKLRVKPSPEKMREELLASKSFTLVGFTKTNQFIIQLSNGKVVTCDDWYVTEHFEKEIAPVAPRKVERMEFKRISGGKIYRTELAAQNGFSVGDKLVLRAGVTAIPKVLMSSDFTLVGFSDSGSFIVQLSSGEVTVDSYSSFIGCFRKV